jgi:hypothetical protein
MSCGRDSLRHRRNILNQPTPCHPLNKPRRTWPRQRRRRLTSTTQRSRPGNLRMKQCSGTGARNLTANQNHPSQRLTHPCSHPAHPNMLRPNQLTANGSIPLRRNRYYRLNRTFTSDTRKRPAEVCHQPSRSNMPKETGTTPRHPRHTAAETPGSTVTNKPAHPNIGKERRPRTYKEIQIQQVHHDPRNTSPPLKRINETLGHNPPHTKPMALYPRQPTPVTAQRADHTHRRPQLTEHMAYHPLRQCTTQSRTVKHQRTLHSRP